MGTTSAPINKVMHNYVACELGAEIGRVMLGTLNHGELKVSEVHRFDNQPIREKDSLQWNIPQLYQDLLDGFRTIAGYEEAIDSISCQSWGADYLLFESDGSLITPAYHQADSRTDSIMKKVLSKIPLETVYEETGVPPKRS